MPRAGKAAAPHDASSAVDHGAGDAPGGALAEFTANPHGSGETSQEHESSDDPLLNLLDQMAADHASIPTLLTQLESAKALLAERDREHAVALARARALGGDASIRQALLTGFGPVTLVMAFIGLVLAMQALFFGNKSDDECTSLALAEETRPGIETAIGLAPVWARNAVILALLAKCCRKVSGMEGDGLATSLLLGQPQHRGGGSAAGWLRIASVQVTDGVLQPQSTWEEAYTARHLTRQQALSSAAAKLVLWHWSQPLAYLLVLEAYKCSLDDTQQLLASLVAAREVLYLVTTLIAVYACPVFLLLDLFTVVKETDSRLQRGLRLAA